MTDSKALIERLRDTACQGVELAIKNGRYVSPHEAADHIEKLEADNARLQGLLREAEVKLTDVQGAYATKQYSANLLTRIRAALQETSHD